MIKKIKKYGNTLVIRFTKEEQEIYQLKEGDVLKLNFKGINISETQLNKNGGKNDRKKKV